MVMFHPEIPYAEAQRRGALQAQILRELSDSVESLPQVDFKRAVTLVDRSL
jgi:kynurenine 3-monooxygenase